MESDGEELDYDFDTPQKPPLTASRMAASAGKNQGQPREEATGAVAKANDDANAGADGGGNKTKRANDDRDVEEELYGDIVSPGDNGGAGGSGGGGAALLTLQVAELKRRVLEQESRISELEATVIRLREERDSLAADRSTLVRNISSLFSTAKEEIARKDAAIREARGGLVEGNRGSRGGRGARGGGRGGRSFEGGDRGRF